MEQRRPGRSGGLAESKTKTTPKQLRNKASRMMRQLGSMAAIGSIATMFLAAVVQAQVQAPAAAQSQQTAQAASGQPQPQGEAGQAAAPPFVLTPPEQAELGKLLAAWEQQSSGTKRLEAKFRRWHFDPISAPAGTHATWAEGIIKYGAPDQGLFRVDQLKFFSGIVEGKTTYKAVEGQFGEHWVCNGQELMEFDRSKEECRIQQLPPELQGKEILESPLPFVFNLNAARIHERYWVRRIEGPAGVYVIEAHPKRQVDRAQYKFVRIVISDQTFLPQALILYAPNFDPTNTIAYDHYEFTDVERNTIRQNMANWGNLFINQRPPANWKVIREAFRPVGPPPQVAQPAAEKTLR
jgi:TIGR03009 family protein